MPWWGYVAYGLVGLVAWRVCGGAIAFGWESQNSRGQYVKPGHPGWKPSYGAGVGLGFVCGAFWPLVILGVLASKVTLPPWPLPSPQEREHRKRVEAARVKELERKAGL